METVTVTQRIDAPAAAIRNAMADTGPFMRAAGFDDVYIEDEYIEVSNTVGIATIELTLEILNDIDADFGYRQESGIFNDMRTTYTVIPCDNGNEVSAATDFELQMPLGGDILDSTIIKRQRRKELGSQIDWLRDHAE